MPQDEENSKRRRLVFRLLVALLVSLLLITVIFMSLLLFFPRERARVYFETRLAQRLSEQAKVYSQAFRYAPPAGFVMERLVITDPATALREFEAEKVIFKINPFFFFGGRNPIAGVEIDSPVVNVRRTRSGHWNVEKLVKTPEEPEEARKSEFGPITIRDGIIRFFGRDNSRLLAISRIAAKIRLKRDLILIESASLQYSLLHADFEGTISDFTTEYPRVDLESSGKILGKNALEAAARDEREKDRHIAEFSLKGAGPISNIELEGSFSVNESAAGEPAVQGEARGVLNGDKELLQVTDLRLERGESLLLLTGAAKDLWSDKRTARLSGTIHAVLEPLFDAAGESIAEQIEADGSADGAVEIGGGGAAIEFQADLDLHAAGFTIPRVLRKETDVPATLFLDGRYTAGGPIVVDELRFTLRDAAISGNARIDPGAESGASLHSTNFPLPYLDRLPAVAFPEGYARFDARVSHAAGAAEAVDYQVQATLQEAQLTTDRLNEPIENLNSKLSFEDQRIEVENAQFTVADSQYDISGELSDFSSPVIDARLRSKRINLPGLAAAVRRGGEGEKQREETGTSLLERMELKLQIEADSVYTGKFLTGPVTSTLQGSGNVYQLSPASIRVFGGEVRGNAEFVPAGRKVLWRADLEGKDMKMEEIMDVFRRGESNITGLLQGKAKVQGMLPGSAGEVLQSLDGTFELTTKDGKVTKSPVLTAILNLFQVPVGGLLVPGLRETIIANTVIDFFRTGGRSIDISSVAYTTIEGDFAVAQGVATTDDLRFDSGVVNLIASGKVNLVTRELDMRVSATPLGALASLMGEIPLLGGAIRGATGAVTSADFVVGGTLSNPDVRPVLPGRILPG